MDKNQDLPTTSARAFANHAQGIKSNSYKSLYYPDSNDKENVAPNHQNTRSSFGLNSRKIGESSISLDTIDEEVVDETTAEFIKFFNDDATTASLERSDDETCFDASFGKDYSFNMEDREEFKLDLSYRNKDFHWYNYYAGVVVEQVRSTQTWKLVDYKITPFGTSEQKPIELWMPTDDIYQIGDWVKFHKKDLYERNIETTYPAIEPMLHTIPCIDTTNPGRHKVYIECEIVLNVF